MIATVWKTDVYQVYGTEPWDLYQMYLFIPAGTIFEETIIKYKDAVI